VFVWIFIAVYTGSVDVDIVRGISYICTMGHVQYSYPAETAMFAPVVLTTYNVPTGILITSTFVVYMSLTLWICSVLFQNYSLHTSNIILVSNKRRQRACKDSGHGKMQYHSKDHVTERN